MSCETKAFCPPLTLVLFPAASSSQGGGGQPSATELNALRSQISDKDRLIETMEQDNEKARAVREMEERLISSAFYNLSMQMHRNAAEARLNSHQGGGGGA